MIEMSKPGDTLRNDPVKILNDVAFDDVTFDDVYIIGEEINSGAFGVVYETHHISNESEIFAVKITSAEKENDKDNVLQEVSMLRKVQNIPDVIQLIDFYVDKEKICIVQTLAYGGDVLDRILLRKTYTEKDARELARNLISIMKSLHGKRIVHRDVKPENLLLKTVDDDTQIYLCDFGDAKVLPEKGGLSTYCGTPEYTAPEVSMGITYRQEVDMWSVGCILFLLLGGYMPFGNQDDPEELYTRSIEADYDFDEEDWDDISEDAKRLIYYLLKVHPRERWSASKALQCGWLDHPKEAPRSQRRNSLEMRYRRNSLQHNENAGVHSEKNIDSSVLKYLKNCPERRQRSLDMNVSEMLHKEEEGGRMSRCLDAWKSNDLFAKPFYNKFTKNRFVVEENSRRSDSPRSSEDSVEEYDNEYGDHSEYSKEEVSTEEENNSVDSKNEYDEENSTIGSNEDVPKIYDEEEIDSTCKESTRKLNDWTKNDRENKLDCPQPEDIDRNRRTIPAVSA